MEWVETTGRTLDEAKEAALDQLGVDETDAEFEVLEEPRAGLFGRVRGEARVRARVRPTAPRPKEDRRDRRRRGRSGTEASGGDAVTISGSSAAGVAVADAGSSSPGHSGRPRGSGGSGRGNRSGGNGPSEAAPVEEPQAGAAEPDPERAAAAGDERPARKPRRRSGGSRTARVPASTDSVATDAPGGDSAGEAAKRPSSNGRAEMSVDVPLDEQGRVAEDFLRGLISEFGMQASVKVTTSAADEEVRLDLTGSDLGLLIGPKGSTLLAVQDLTRTAVHHKTHAGNGRMLVDVGAYRQKRSEALARFAQQVADKVKETGSPTALEPMAAPDRKVVHDAITDIEGVSTISEGEEPRRRVVIVPASANAATSTNA